MSFLTLEWSSMVLGALVSFLVILNLMTMRKLADTLALAKTLGSANISLIEQRDAMARQNEIMRRALDEIGPPLDELVDEDEELPLRRTAPIRVDRVTRKLEL